RNLRRQVAAIDEFRHDEAQAVLGATQIMNGHDVNMIEAGENSSFGQIRFGIFGPGEAFTVRDLDRDIALELVVEAAIDNTEPAGTQQGGNTVTTESGRQACREGGWWRRHLFGGLA